MSGRLSRGVTGHLHHLIGRSQKAESTWLMTVNESTTFSPRRTDRMEMEFPSFQSCTLWCASLATPFKMPCAAPAPGMKHQRVSQLFGSYLCIRWQQRTPTGADSSKTGSMTLHRYHVNCDGGRLSSGESHRMIHYTRHTLHTFTLT